MFIHNCSLYIQIIYPSLIQKIGYTFHSLYKLFPESSLAEDFVHYHQDQRYARQHNIILVLKLIKQHTVGLGHFIESISFAKCTHLSFFHSFIDSFAPHSHCRVFPASSLLTLEHLWWKSNDQSDFLQSDLILFCHLPNCTILLLQFN